MIKLEALKRMNTEEKYKYMLILLEGQLNSETDALANISNASAIIYAVLDRINWAGFYLIKKDTLVLGPFQGLPACNRIEQGRGVCGTAVLTQKVIRVENVHEFPGHIACDSASNSEIVLPLIKNEIVYGVLDIDSPDLGRFTELEQKYLTLFVQKLNDNIDWENI
jgi:L-methionine (R)-S-oxide reductase